MKHRVNTEVHITPIRIIISDIVISSIECYSGLNSSLQKFWLFISQLSGGWRLLLTRQSRLYIIKVSDTRPEVGKINVPLIELGLIRV